MTKEELLKQRNESVKMLKEAKATIKSLQMLIGGHPDCQEDGEFKDFYNIASTHLSRIEKFINQIENK